MKIRLTSLSTLWRPSAISVQRTSVAQFDDGERHTEDMIAGICVPSPVLAKNNSIRGNFAIRGVCSDSELLGV